MGAICPELLTIMDEGVGVEAVGGAWGAGGEKPSPVRKMVSDRKRASSRTLSGPPSRR